MGLAFRYHRSLYEMFFEGSRSCGREDCLSTRGSFGEKIEVQGSRRDGGVYDAEFRSAEKNIEGTA
jgi:hypothetical protein